MPSLTRSLRRAFAHLIDAALGRPEFREVARRAVAPPLPPRPRQNNWAQDAAAAAFGPRPQRAPDAAPPGRPPQMGRGPAPQHHHPAYLQVPPQPRRPGYVYAQAAPPLPPRPEQCVYRPEARAPRRPAPPPPGGRPPQGPIASAAEAAAQSAWRRPPAAPAPIQQRPNAAAQEAWRRHHPPAALAPAPAPASEPGEPDEPDEPLSADDREKVESAAMMYRQFYRWNHSFFDPMAAFTASAIGRPIVIHSANGTPPVVLDHDLRGRKLPGRPIEIFREDNHFSGTRPDGTLKEIPKDGNCFFASVLYALGGDAYRDPSAIQELRDRVADHIEHRQNAPRAAPFLVEEGPGSAR